MRGARYYRSCCIAAYALLAGCGGHSSAGSLVAPATSPSSVAAASTTKAAVTLAIPVRSSTLTQRFPRYVSASTRGLRIGISGLPAGSTAPATLDIAVIPGSPACPLAGGSYVCSISMSLPAPALLSFSVQLFDQAPSVNGAIPSGAQLLASGILQNFNIPPKTLSISIPVTLSGTAATVDAAFAPGTALPRAAAGQVTIAARVRDPGGNAIVGNAPYIDTNGNPLTIALNIPASITGYTIAVRPAGSATFGPPGTSAAISSPGDQIQVSEAGGASNQAGVIITAAMPNGNLLGVLRVPVSISGAVSNQIYCCGNPQTVTSVPPDVSVPGNAPGQGVFWGDPSLVNGSTLYNKGESAGTSITCSALNTIDVGLAPGFPGIMNTANNGGYFYYRAYRMGAFAGGCTGAAADFVSFPTNAGAFDTTPCGYAPPAGHTPPCSMWGMPEAYPFNPTGGPGTIYINSFSGTATGIQTATYTPGSFSSLTYSPTPIRFTINGGIYGIAPLPGRVFAALAWAPGYDVYFPNSNTMVDGTNATNAGVGPLESPVALSDGTIYALNNSGNLARCRVDPNPTVTTGVSCDPTIFATLTPPAFYARQRVMALGPDGALWYATNTANLGRFDLTTMTSSAVPAIYNTISVTGGYDGRVYFTDTARVVSFP